MKALTTISTFLLLSINTMAQQATDMSDTISFEPIESEYMHAPREATEAEKEYARQLALQRQEQQQIEYNLPVVDENGQVVTANDYYAPYPFLYPDYYVPYTPLPWNLHKGLNVNLGTSVFANFGKGVNHGAGFTQDVALQYVTNLSPKATLAVGGYLNNTIWDGSNYTAAGITALLGYRFNEHWSAYAFVQKAFTSSNYGRMGWFSPYYGGFGYGHPWGYGLHAYGYDRRMMDRIGGGVRYEWGNHNSIEIQVEVDHMPNHHDTFYNHRRYDYPVR